MLVLGRKKRERVVIIAGDEIIEVEVVNINLRQNYVRLGFNARQDVKILRGELYDGDNAGCADPTPLEAD